MKRFKSASHPEGKYFARANLGRTLDGVECTCASPEMASHPVKGRVDLTGLFAYSLVSSGNSTNLIETNE